VGKCSGSLVGVYNLAGLETEIMKVPFMVEI